MDKFNMEKTDNISIPAEFSAPPKKKFNPIDNLRKNKKPTDLTEVRERLPKINRTVNCIHCKQERILNPDQYQSHYDYWGDEDKLLRNFVCKPCEMQINDNPFKFWAIYSDHYRKLGKALKVAFDLFRNSAKTAADELAMTQLILSTLAEANIFADPNLLANKNLTFIIENQNVIGLKIHDIPFVGTIILTPYDTTTKVTIS